MARTNFTFEKRQRELKKREKKEAKLAKKAERSPETEGPPADEKHRP